MDHELVITEDELNNRFQNERDIVTLSPYRVGDRVVRCSSCRRVIKTEYVSDRCPICGHSPFVPAPVYVPAVQNESIRYRSSSLFLWLLLLSAGTALVPFLFSGLHEYIYEATFGVGLNYSFLYVCIVSNAVAIIIYNNQKAKRTWRNSNKGYWYLLIPVCAPYCLLGFIWAVLFLLSIIIFIGIMGAILSMGGS